MHKRYLLLLFCALFFSACTAYKATQHLHYAKINFNEGNYQEAFHSLLPIAVNGNEEAQYAVGYMYYYGLGVKEDNESGFFWMKLAAEHHNTKAIQAINLINSLKEKKNHPFFINKKATPKKANLKQIKSNPKKLTPSKQRFTLQLYGSYHLRSVQQEKNAFSFLHKNLLVFRTTFKEKPWYILTYGQFASLHSTKLAKKKLPLFLQKFNPWIRPLKNISLLTV